MSDSLVDSGKDADEELESKSSSDSVTNCSKKKTWVEVKVVDAKGDAVDGVDVTITLPDGNTKQGQTKDGGIFAVQDIDPGNGKCKVAVSARIIDWLEPV